MNMFLSFLQVFGSAVSGWNRSDGSSRRTNTVSIQDVRSHPVAVSTRHQMDDRHTGQIVNQYAGQMVNQYVGQMTNQYAGQMSNQNAGQMVNRYAGQMVNQYVGQMTNQYAGQMSNQNAGQMVNRYAGHMPNQYAGQMPNQYNGQMPNQYAGQMPNQYADQMPNQHAGQMSNQYASQMSNQYASQMPNQYADQMPNQYAGQMSNQHTGYMFNKYSGQTSNHNAVQTTNAYANPSFHHTNTTRELPAFSGQATSSRLGQGKTNPAVNAQHQSNNLTVSGQEDRDNGTTSGHVRHGEPAGQLNKSGKPKKRRSAPTRKSAPVNRTGTSYLEMMVMCILNHPEEKMFVKELYEAISIRYPDRDSSTPSQVKIWHDHVRYELSLKTCFMKVGSRTSRGHQWGIHPACLDLFVSGNFDQRAATKLVKKYNTSHQQSWQSLLEQEWNHCWFNISMIVWLFILQTIVWKVFQSRPGRSAFFIVLSLFLILISVREFVYFLHVYLFCIFVCLKLFVLCTYVLHVFFHIFVTEVHLGLRIFYIFSECFIMLQRLK